MTQNDHPAPSADKQVQSAARKKSKDRWVKLIFLAIILAAAVGVYMRQRSDLVISGWENDLKKTLATAKAENRNIVVFFLSSPPSVSAKRNKERIQKPENRTALQDGKFLSVLVTLPISLDDDLAKRYEIKALPTLLILDPQGKPLLDSEGKQIRHEGEIGEVPFRQVFLAKAKAS